ncbi:hypothetical protein [Plasmodium yoelii yoelii]|uniref:Uncharacterized protein n=1 Tax=Plasmodium yoelii yoelii TaxID=73239 RepID=Q7RRE6_PLAYO|nr:hypothetical protein [Plasmodium yoelii yoelii]
MKYNLFMHFFLCVFFVCLHMDNMCSLLYIKVVECINKIVIDNLYSLFSKNLHIKI